MRFDNILAERTRIMSASAIREILKVVSKPGMVSLAGGIPSPDSFPMGVMRELTERVITKYGSSAFQYDLTEGFQPLREALSGYLAKKGLKANADEIRITSGSQGGLVELGMILITKGDAVAVEAPTYLGAISAFNPYEPRYLRIDTDDDGLIPESLEALLKKETVKFIYLNPTFQNPTGRTLTLERRKVVAEIVQRFNVLLVEDDPYSDLRYRGNPLPPIKTMAPDHTVYLGTLSKVFAPGLRLGFFLAPEPIRRWMVLAKQGIDLHTSTFNQALAAEFIAGGYMEKHLPNILRIYKPRQEAMLGALEKYFPKSATWSKPEGGMFIWVECPKGMDAERINERGLERNVAFVPGRFFYTREGEGLNTMRLNYTMSDEPAFDRAVKTLSEVVKEMLPGK
jgi:2-aminoadipate transaminase